MRYLTIQDVIWLNFQVIEHVGNYKFSSLEQTCNSQYALGESKDFFGQSLCFLNQFMKDTPFERGNLATAFITFLSFLRLNNWSLNIHSTEITNYFIRLISVEVKPDELKKDCIEFINVKKLESLSSNLLKEYYEVIQDLLLRD